jgi:hypothetical protein
MSQRLGRRSPSFANQCLSITEGTDRLPPALQIAHELDSHAIAVALGGKGPDQMMDQVSVSLTCLSKKKGFSALSIPKGKCIADHKKSVYSLRRSVEIRY